MVQNFKLKSKDMERVIFHLLQHFFLFHLKKIKIMKKYIFFTLVFLYISFRATSQCNTEKTIPYLENFYTGVLPLNLPECSKNETIEGNSGIWMGSPNNSGGVAYVDFCCNYNGIRAWWFTLKIGVGLAKSYRLTFDYRGLSQPLTNPFVLVKFGTCDSSICMNTLILPVSIGDTVKRTVFKVFAPSINGAINIGFFLNADSYDGCSVAISNISLVEEIPTPVTMGALAAQVQGSTTNLYWQTYTEQNNKGFTVEQSINGQPFTSLGFVPTKAANGNSAAPLSYQYTVGGAATAQYRLHQQDFNGAVSYSNIVAVTSGGKPKAFSVKVLPNPVTNNLQASLYSPAAYKGIAQVVNSTGRQVYVQAVNLPAGFSSLSIPASQWPTGSYYLKINGVVIGFVK